MDSPNKTPQFYALERRVDPLGQAALDFYNQGSRLPAKDCPQCGKHLTSLLMGPPYSVELDYLVPGTADFVMGVGSEFLISQRMLEEVKRQALKGLEYLGPASIVSVNLSKKRLSGLNPRFHCVRPVLSRAFVDDVSSELVKEPAWTCSECRLGGLTKRMKRLVINCESWGNEDVFVARGLTGTVVVSQRFADLCRGFVLCGCAVVRAEDYHFDFYPWELKEGAKLGIRCQT